MNLLIKRPRLAANLINLVLPLVMSIPAWGVNGARLLSMSESKQTALFNLGSLEGIKEGDFAVIVKEIRDINGPDLRLVPVAKARNIKISTANSIWILYKVYNPALLLKGHPYVVLSESPMLQGRVDPRLGRISVITEKEKTALQAKGALSDDKDRISKLKDQYPEIETLHEKESRSDNDFDLVDVEGWRKFKGSKYRTALYKSPHAKDFRRELRLSTFEKLVTAYLQKVNDPKFNYDAFYDEQRKTQFTNEFRVRSNFSSEYEDFLSTQSQKAVADAKLYRSVLEKGDRWSEEFSDEELSGVLKQVSVLQEKDRRKLVMSDPKRYVVSLGYGMSLNESQTEKDAGYRREGRYSVDLDFEATPFLKHETLERFTLNTSFRTNKTAMESNNYNASVDELSLTVGMNWYPLYAPYAIEAPALFFGTYIRSGTASVNAPSANEKANYTVLTLPGFRGGLRYNFRNNVGLKLAFSFESMTLDRYEQSKFNSQLPDEANLAEAKMNFSVAYSF
jgi:hypothetical protein